MAKVNRPPEPDGRDSFIWQADDGKLYKVTKMEGRKRGEGWKRFCEEVARDMEAFRKEEDERMWDMINTNMWNPYQQGTNVDSVNGESTPMCPHQLVPFAESVEELIRCIQTTPNYQDAVTKFCKKYEIVRKG